MSWTEEQDPGKAALHGIRSRLQLSNDWVTDHDTGFIWWPHDLAQNVWADAGVFMHSQSVHRLHAETDLVRGRGQAGKFELALERAIDHCTLSAVVYDAKADTFKLHTCAYLTLDNAEWLQRIFLAAAALQAVEAMELVRHLQATMGAVPAGSGHPANGFRAEPDPILPEIPRYFQGPGQEASRWSGAQEWFEVEKILEREATAFECNHATEFRAEFPWEPTAGSIVLEATSEQPHHKLGNGLHLTLTVPLRVSPDHVAHLALEMNGHERKDWKRCHMLGSWSCHNDALSFRRFIPNSVYHPAVLPQMSLDMAVRAQWANEFFVEKKAQASSGRPGA